MKILESINHLNKYYYEVKDWEKNTFSYEKAFICSVMSNLAYCHLTKYELKNTDNLNLIPSDAFSSIFTGEQSYSFKNLLRGLDVEKPLIIERAGSVVVAVKYRDVIFISIRGTEFLNIRDWKINLKFNKIAPSRYLRTESKPKLHKGFYFEVSSFMDELMNGLKDRGWNNNNIYITGHSLGGAMAAITYSLRQIRFNQLLDEIFLGEYVPKIISCYTYGMPRWGNKEAVEYFENPYHIFISKDIVPSVPPKLMGFHDCKINFNLDSIAFRYIDFSDGTIKTFIKGLTTFFTMKKLEAHGIENYVERIYQQITESE
ncbi:TPA: hypothetical protein ACPVXW_000442 [Vibrio parahaemolyticus]